ncbi:MAG: phosphodiester glycosidase family protein [Armatimonadota bacterium]|nr:phosphodiester glycosidase family protein [bacterium]
MGGGLVKRRRGAWAAVWMLALGALGVLLLLGLTTIARPAGILGRLNINYAVLDISHGHYKVSPALANGADGTEPLNSMVKRLKPHVAICGTYYDENYRPLGDIVVNGKVVCRGSQRQGIGFTSSGKIVFRERKGRSRIDWSGCVSGIACGPRLVRSGKKDINVRRDGFSKAASTNRAWRCAVGKTADGKLILCAVSQSITLNTLADAMLELGAVDAINLDGGSMCAFYENGRAKVEPVKPLNNILAVYKK